MHSFMLLNLATSPCTPFSLLSPRSTKDAVPAAAEEEEEEDDEEPYEEGDEEVRSRVCRAAGTAAAASDPAPPLSCRRCSRPLSAAAATLFFSPAIRAGRGG